jgi:hypothetical protein
VGLVRALQFSNRDDLITQINGQPRMRNSPSQAKSIAIRLDLTSPNRFAFARSVSYLDLGSNAWFRVVLLNAA